MTCKEECGGWAHEICHEVVIEDLNGEKVSRRKRKNFMCNEITINVKRNEIRRYVRHKERHNRRVFTVLSSANSSKKSGIGRKRRYSAFSQNYRCQYCNQEVNVNDLNHELEHCSGFESDPVFGGDWRIHR